MRGYKKVFIICALFVMAIAVVIAASTKKEEHFVFYTHWTAQAQFAGFIMAEKNGYFEKEGINVSVQYHDSVHFGAEMLETGKAQFALLDLMAAIQARQKGLKIVNIMQTSQNSSHCIVTKDEISSINDLNGKEIAVWHGYEPMLMKIVDLKAGGKINWFEMFSGIEVFKEGAVDNVMCTSYNELGQLENIGYILDSFHTIPFSEIGIRIPEEGVYVTESFYNSHKEVVKKFVLAATKGWKFAFEHENRTMQVVLDEMKAADIPHNIYHQKRMLAEIKKLQSVDGALPENYTLDKKIFDETIDIYNLINKGNETKITFKEFTRY